MTRRRPWRRTGGGCVTIEVACSECGKHIYEIDVDEPDSSVGYSGGFGTLTDPCPLCGATPPTDRDVQRILDEQDQDAAERYAENRADD